MKHTSARVSALLLALMLVLLSFTVIGCGETGDSTVTTASAGVDTGNPDESAGETEPVFADADYKEAPFVIFQRNSDAGSYPGIYITSEDVSDMMSEAVFKRNEAVQNQYNIKISAIEKSDPYKDVATLIDSSAVDFTMILDERSHMASLSRKNYLYNWNDLDINFENYWWDSNCARDYDINGKLFFMVNDVSVSNLGNVRFFYFNKDLMKDNQLESPYDLVEKNEWVLDTLLQQIAAVHRDNGDEIKDGNDIYGLCMETGSSNGNVMHLLVGCGIRYSEMSNGELVTRINNQTTDDILTKIATAIKKTPATITYGDAYKGMDNGGLSQWDFGRKLFADGHFLYIQSNMNIATAFANMQQDYGAVVNPKLNSEQKNYAHMQDRYSLIWAIPNYKGMDYDMIANVMDFWAYKSASTVMDTYYEITIKTRRVQDPTASAMLDKVKASVVYDIASDLYNIGVTDVVWEAYDNGRTIASMWNGYSKKINTDMANLMADMDALQ